MKKKSLLMVAFVFVLYFIGYIYNSRYEADVWSEGRRDTAVVNDIYSVNGSRYFEYLYKVDGKIYTGKRNTSQVEYQHIKIGDSIIIEYKYSEPEKSVPYNIIGVSHHAYSSQDSLEDIEKELILYRGLHRKDSLRIDKTTDK